MDMIGKPIRYTAKTSPWLNLFHFLIITLFHARWAGRGVGQFGIAPGSNRFGSSCVWHELRVPDISNEYCLASLH